MSGERTFSLPLVSTAWARIRNFSGLDGTATYLGPRWLLLRSVGLVFIVVFAGIIAESQALIGPHGLTPLPALIDQLRAAHANPVVAFLRAPSLFWLNASPAMIYALEWGGMLAAIALVLNLWPRMALFACWLCLLSFAQGWVIFSDPLLDWMMLEIALLSIPFAPAGYRPGLGERSAPRPIAVFMMRWLLFRVMLECGLCKFINADPRWLDFTAMDALYQTAPSPTILGYWVHQLPHWWHVGEVWFTIVAEIIAPLLVMFGGRRARWFAFVCWTLFQLGIQATCNFAWLNTGSIALGLLILDDHMLASLADRLRLKRVARSLATAAERQIQPALARWRLNTLRTALWVQFTFGLILFVESCQIELPAAIRSTSSTLKLLFQGFGSTNSYNLYAWLDQHRGMVEFIGSNDGGQTWRSYDLRYYPQRADHISPFIAPYFPRFEGTMQIEVSTREKPTALFAITAQRLLERNPEVMGLFANDPFPDRPAQMIRLVTYRATFTDAATLRATRNYWDRHYFGEYLPMRYLNDAGVVAEADTVFRQIYVKAAYGNPSAQGALGLLYLNGEEDVEKDPTLAERWLRSAAEQGEAGAQFNLALLYLTGDGVPKNPAEAVRWCRLAAEQGIPEAQDRLAIMYYEGIGVPRDATESLVWFKVAGLSGFAEAARHQVYAERSVSPAGALAADQRSRTLFAEIDARKKRAGK